MTSRERVLTSLNHSEPDKVPIDLGGTMCSSLTIGAGGSLKKYLNLNKPEEIVTNPLSGSIDVCEEILNLFQVDFRTVRMKGPGNAVPGSPVSDREVTDEFGTVWRKTGFDYVPVEFSYAGADISDLTKLPKPDPGDPGRTRGIKDEAKTLHEDTAFAIIADFVCGGPFEQAQRIRGFEQFMVDLYADPDFSRALLSMLTDNAIGFWDAMLSETGEYVDVVCQGDDLGMQTDLQISPEMYRTFIKPCHQRLFDFIHSKTKAKLWLHSCGSVYEIIPDLIETGVDVLNPVQTGARHMELERLKGEFGKEISFWGGGIDIQNLPFLKKDEIYKHVKKAMEIMAPGGGYVFSASHNILPDTSGENIHAAFMAAVEFR